MPLLQNSKRIQKRLNKLHKKGVIVMKIINAIQFLDNATSPQESEVLINTSGSQLTLDISGSATTFALKILGSATLTVTDTWTPLSAINLSDYTIASIIATKGIYTIPIDGIGRIKISLTETNGATSVAGKVGE